MIRQLFHRLKHFLFPQPVRAQINEQIRKLPQLPLRSGRIQVSQHYSARFQGSKTQAREQRMRRHAAWRAERIRQAKLLKREWPGITS